MGKHGGIPPTWTSTRGKTNKSTFRSTFGSTTQEIWGTAGMTTSTSTRKRYRQVDEQERFISVLPSPPHVDAVVDTNEDTDAPNTTTTNNEREHALILNLIRNGESEYLNGNLDMAEKLLREVVCKKPDETEAYTLLSRVYEERGDIYDGYVQQKKLIMIIPQSENQRRRVIPSHQYRRCARLAELCNMLDDAVDWYTQALHMEPADRESCTSRALIFMRTGREAMAVDTLQGMLHLFPNDVHLKINMAHAHRLLDHVDDAIRLYMEVARDVLSPVVDTSTIPTTTIQKDLVRADEDEVITIGLSAVSALVDYLISEERFEQGAAIITRCRHFLQHGICDNPKMTWSWDQTGLKPGKSIPLDVAVQGAICELRRDFEELGMEKLNVIRAVVQCLVRIPNPPTPAQAQLAWNLVKALFSVQDHGEIAQLGIQLALKYVMLDRQILGPECFADSTFLENLAQKVQQDHVHVAKAVRDVAAKLKEDDERITQVTCMGVIVV